MATDTEQMIELVLLELAGGPRSAVDLCEVLGDTHYRVHKRDEVKQAIQILIERKWIVLGENSRLELPQ